MNKLSYYLSPLVGLFTIAFQIVTFYVRFGRMNTDATILDYILFFIAGTVGGLILIYFLNRQTSNAKRWAVTIAFLLATPIAMIMSLVGGAVGPIGVILFPQIPWALITWIGSLVAKWV